MKKMIITHLWYVDVEENISLKKCTYVISKICLFNKVVTKFFANFAWMKK